MGWITRAVLCLTLATFYVVAANRHATNVNWFKARGDQTGYLIDAKDVYANWHTPGPGRLIGSRNRMPLYAAVLAATYDPRLSDNAFFERGRRVNIYLSLVLLLVVWLTASRYLQPHAAANVTGVAAFGWFIFKAGYTQSELLFYTLFFLAFASCLELFAQTPERRLLLVAPVAGALLGLAHLTKAATLPFAGIVLVVGVGWAIAPVIWPRPEAPTGPVAPPWRHISIRVAALVLLTAVFLAVLWPYISTSKRVFGHYFYNVNSTFYVWYDNWPLASVGTALHNDGEHWPDMPDSELPGPARYWREHSMGQMALRVSAGFSNMGVVLRRDFDLLPYLGLYLGAFVVLCASRMRTVMTMLRDHAWEAAFVASYGGAYLLATAFYNPISGTGTGRFLLAHALPFFFVLARVIASPRFADLSWGAGPRIFTTRHFDWLVSAVLLFNVAFRVWPRLMSTYGGF